ncbi:hypothetical protein KN815_42490 [Streptomyces sp. 4503]|uniref:Uncharacterized protein n=1 Tax=Streptomyces niphimycinicus TaxID=2842201 RepID=A0ABS6CUK4_9ACTN|nr:hypothetical protein [Streptomyces niphimycinicus]MBU3870479.1 hypothetical protein [Streptomyces niphimycinicus]
MARAGVRPCALGWLGKPIEIDDPHETQLVDRLRRLVFAGDPARPLQHLGEAETLTLIQNRPEYTGSVWISRAPEDLRH